jgi:hypothetical protein
MSRTTQLHTGNQSLITAAASASFSVTASYALTAPGGGLSGGTTNYIPLWTGAGTLSSSAIYQTSNIVGIGTTSPNASAKLHVSNGKITIDNNNAFASLDSSGTSRDILKLNASNQLEIAGAGAIIDAVIIKTVGSDRLKIDNAGNVGIGTAVPSASLHVAGAVGTAPLGTGVLMGIENNYGVIHLNGSNGGYIDFSNGTGTDYIGRIINFNSDKSMRFEVNSGAAMTISGSGNVGIGTTSPGQKLDVVGAVRANQIGGLFIANDNISGTDASMNIYLSFQRANVEKGWVGFGDGSNGLFRVRNSIGNLRLDASNEVQLWAGSNQRVTVNISGGVGIGTIAPSSSLHVSGSSTTENADHGTFTMEAAGVSGLTFGYDSSAQRSWIYSRTIGVTGRPINVNGTMYVNAFNGGVGIGKTPSYALDVNGIIAINATPMMTSSTNYNVIYHRDVGAGIYLGGGSDPNSYYDNNNHYFRNRGSTTRMSILGSSGNVGIGTTSPATTLHVAGGMARTNTRISSEEVYPVGHYTPGETVFEINTTWTDAELQEYFNSPNVSWTGSTDAPGGYAIYINGAVDVGGEYNSGFPYIPVDQDDVFYMECWIKNVGTNQAHYMGSMDYNHNLVSLGGNPGTYGYWVMSNTNPTTTWTKVSGYIKGFGSATGQFVAGTKYWTPQALFNYTAGTGTRACIISGWKVIKVNAMGNRFFSGSVGIGTTNPQTRLDVHGTISIGGNVVLTGSAAYTQLLRPDGPVAIYLGATDPGNYYDNTNHYFRDRSNNIRWQINSSGHLIAGIDNTYDIGASGATRPRNVFVAGNVSASQYSGSGFTLSGTSGLVMSGSGFIRHTSGSVSATLRANPANSAVEFGSETFHVVNMLVNGFSLYQFGIGQFLTTNPTYTLGNPANPWATGFFNNAVLTNGQLTISGSTGATNGIVMNRSGWNGLFRIGAVSSSGDDFWITNNWNPQTNAADSAEPGYITLAPKNELRTVINGSRVITATSNAVSVTGSLSVSGSTYLRTAVEHVVGATTAPPTTLNYNVLDGAILFHSASTTANWTLNFRGNASTTLNSMMPVSSSMTVTLLTINAGTAYSSSAYQIDGTSITPRWQGGTSGSANANSIDAHTFTIVKTSSTPTYLLLGSITRYS